MALAGGACGLVNSIAGGGSLILFPVLLAVGLPPLDANVTNSVAAWPGYVGGVGGFRSEIRGQRHRLPRLLAATVVGSVCGCVLLLITPSGAFDAIVPFLVLLASALTAVQPVVRRRLANGDDDGGAPGAAAVLGVFAATVYGGYFGAALGVIVLGVLGVTIGAGLRKLNATKAVITLVTSTIGVAIFGLFGPVDWGYVAVAAPTTLLGGYAGAHIARRVDEDKLRVAVVALGVVAAVILFVRL